MSDKKWRIAFAGFRHGHILDLYTQAQKNPRVEIVAAAESDAGARQGLEQKGLVKLTHQTLDQVLSDVPCDIIATGDYYAARGPIALKALQAGKHVMADKPLCISIAELDQIEKLSSQKKLSVGCMFTMREEPTPRTIHRVLSEGAIGEVHTVTFLAQHPLILGTRPGWYFEPGKHGGTINDIGIHAIDGIPWMTGRKWKRVNAARVWNARLPQFPHFQDGAQMMLELDNGGGVLGDLSYLAPDTSGYSAPQYWRFTIHGTEGVLESVRKVGLQVTRHEDKEARVIPLDQQVPGAVLDAFIDEIEGKPKPGNLTTAEVLKASRLSLQVQQAADEGKAGVSLV